ncbi:purine-binding chemotaxis protein CheW [Leptolyngbya sp. NK1-12]|uniref:Purine-binding chemotaxis protein CheW n=1 Tax=Leptolyngbya sp. NK1-12 TaxID=2547451 RepID=A0AA97APC7_9CYAN|nr:chemotaxis protein CheW [Leptolyngbya sp. NK1-12]WNZ27737.1 purine-binding chemotaxis protein CheW [Leptolyngbya sp. NK1-12]
MSIPQFLELQDILSLARKGDPSAIAALINHILNPKGITAKVGWNHHCLGILLEALPVPDQEEMIAFIRQNLADLQPESIRLVKVGGYQRGQSVPTWYEEIELEGRVTASPEMDYSAPSLIRWLNQGLVPNEEKEENSDALPSSLLASSAFDPETLDLAHLTATNFAANEQRFLCFYLNTEETALLPLSQIQQVLKIPVVEILPVPHMPNCVLGIYNWRGEMLWLVDLAQQLNFASGLNLPSMETLTTIVIQTDRNYFGIVVPRLSEIETHNPQRLQLPTSAFPAKLLSIMQGYFSPSGIPVLNANALIQDPLLQVHCVHLS